jgi:hypothetical protein
VRAAGVAWQGTWWLLGGSGSIDNGIYCCCLTCLRLEKFCEDAVGLERRTEEFNGALRSAGHKNAGIEAWRAPVSSWTSFLVWRSAVLMLRCGVD